MGHMIDVNGKGKTAIIAIKVDISISSETLVIQIVIYIRITSRSYSDF